MNTVKKVDVELLKMIPQTSEKARVLLEAFSTRQRGRLATTYIRAYQILRNKGISLTKPEYLTIFTDLQQAGAGKLIQQGRFIKFDWHWHLKSVADLALGLGEKLKNPPKTRVKVSKIIQLEPKKRAVTLPIAAAPASPPAPTHDIVTIRRGEFEIDIDLMTMTNSECKKIKNLLIELTN